MGKAKAYGGRSAAGGCALSVWCGMALAGREERTVVDWIGRPERSNALMIRAGTVKGERTLSAGSAPVLVKALTSCEIMFGMEKERCWAGEGSWFEAK